MVDVTTRTITFTEALAAGLEQHRDHQLPGPHRRIRPAPSLTTNGSDRTFTVSLDIAHPARLVHHHQHQGRAPDGQKTWVNALHGDVATVNTTGAANNA